jgi:hypothetical protein
MSRFRAAKEQPSFRIPFRQEVTNEVTEMEGTLLVRLGGASAMQVRVEEDKEHVLIRTVPIAKATLLHDDANWHVATDSQLWSWIQSESAIGQWLLAHGIDSYKIERRVLATSAANMPHRRSAFFFLRSKSSPSLP